MPNIHKQKMWQEVADMEMPKEKERKHRQRSTETREFQ